MREIQCSNVSVSLKTAITVHSSWVKWSWKLERLHEQQYPMCGTMHAMCGQTLRMSEELDIFRHARSSGLTLEYTGAALKLFGPFSLVPGLIKHLCVLWRAWPSPTCGTHPSLVKAHREWALLLLPTPQSQD